MALATERRRYAAPRENGRQRRNWVANLLLGGSSSPLTVMMTVHIFNGLTVSVVRNVNTDDPVAIDTYQVSLLCMTAGGGESESPRSFEDPQRRRRTKNCYFFVWREVLCRSLLFAAFAAAEKAP
jgi:hypothetical protein